MRLHQLLPTQGSSSLVNADRRAEAFLPRTAAATAAWEQPFPDSNARAAMAHSRLDKRCRHPMKACHEKGFAWLC